MRFFRVLALLALMAPVANVYSMQKNVSYETKENFKEILSDLLIKYGCFLPLSCARQFIDAEKLWRNLPAFLNPCAFVDYIFDEESSFNLPPEPWEDLPKKIKTD